MEMPVACMIACCLVLASAGTSTAQEFQRYPGAKLDDKSSRQASRANTECQVFLTPDGYDKVYAFYKAIYKEHPRPFQSQKLPSGADLQWAFFILDGGKDLAHSRYWMKIQRPFIGTVDDAADFKDIRDVSVIQTVRTH